MGISKATATWTGGFKDGSGVMKPENGGESVFSAGSRFEGQKGSNPEELIGAALAGCFSMALTVGLEKAGLAPKRIDTTANVRLERIDNAPTVTHIALTTIANIPGADAAKFAAVAEETKRTCPISRLLAAATITLDAKLA